MHDSAYSKSLLWCISNNNNNKIGLKANYDSDLLLIYYIIYYWNAQDITFWKYFRLNKAYDS